MSVKTYNACIYMYKFFQFLLLHHKAQFSFPAGYPTSHDIIVSVLPVPLVLAPVIVSEISSLFPDVLFSDFQLCKTYCLTLPYGVNTT